VLADTDGRDDSRIIKDEVVAKKLLKLPTVAISDDVSLLLEGYGVLSPECRLQRLIEHRTAPLRLGSSLLDA
jgi:hypothetical protein